jgi:hypothetical protein
MAELSKFIIEWLKKNKTLFFFIFSLSLLVLPTYNAKEDNLSFYLLKSFLLSFGVTRVLVYLNVVKLILSTPVISDAIFWFGREETFLINTFNEFITKKPEEYEYLKTIYEVPTIRIRANEINDKNLKVISLLQDIEHYNFLEDYKITNQFQNLTLNKDILTTLKSTIQPAIQDFNNYITQASTNESEKIKNLQTEIQTIHKKIQTSYTEASSSYIKILQDIQASNQYASVKNQPQLQRYPNHVLNSFNNLITGEVTNNIKNIKFNSQEIEIKEFVKSLSEDCYKDLVTKFVQLANLLQANVLNDDILISFSLKPVIIRQIKKNASKIALPTRKLKAKNLPQWKKILNQCLCFKFGKSRNKSE